MPDNLIYAGSRHRIRRWRNYGITSSPPVAPVEFLFRDDFLTAEAAPLTSPRTAEPGPGTETITDTGNTLDIIDGELLSNASAIGAGDPRVVSANSFVRSIGLDFSFLLRRIDTAVGESQNPTVGWGINNNPLFATMFGVFLRSNTVIRVVLTGVGIDQIAIHIVGVADRYHIIARSIGFFVVQNLELVWIDDSNNNDPLWPAITSNAAGRDGFGTDNWRVSQLPSPWDTDFGIATDRLAGARAPLDAFVHEADCLIEFTVTTVGIGAGANDIFFRMQDANNYWRIRVQVDGNFILSEVVGGAPTNRFLAGIGTVNNGDRCVIICDDETIRGYVDNALEGTYALAANFKTETDGELNLLTGTGVVSDIISWPRVISGDALIALNRVANA